MISLFFQIHQVYQNKFIGQKISILKFCKDFFRATHCQGQIISHDLIRNNNALYLSNLDFVKQRVKEGKKISVINKFI